MQIMYFVFPKCKGHFTGSDIRQDAAEGAQRTAHRFHGLSLHFSVCRTGKVCNKTSLRSLVCIRLCLCQFLVRVIT